MSFAPRVGLAFGLSLAYVGSAHAVCPATMTQSARIDCLSLVLTNALGTIATLQAQVAQLQADSVPGLGDYLTVDTTTDSVVFEGANVFVQSGSGSTTGAVNGLGNLILGYDEDLYDVYGASYANDRSGSHNLVIGPYNTYSSYCAFVAGYWNNATAPYASIIAGYGSNATGTNAVVVGGYNNQATGSYSLAAGGLSVEATNTYSAAVSGAYNSSSGWASTVSGGYGNLSDGTVTVVSGGGGGYATGNGGAISGGFYGTSSGFYSSVTGGAYSSATANYSTMLGGYSGTVSTEYGVAP
jgi:hypothetical protein